MPLGQESDNDDVVLKGATDGTLIGNVGDRLKVNATFGTITIGRPFSFNASLRYEDMNLIARNSAILGNGAFTTIYSVTGSGLLNWFLINLESKDHWLVRLVVDGQEIFGSTGLKSMDMQAGGAYDLDKSNDEESDAFGLRWGKNEKLLFSGPMSIPIEFTTSLSIKIARTNGESSKKFKAGLACVVK